MSTKVIYTTHPCLNHAPAVPEAAPSKSSFQIIAEKLDQHVLGRISAAAQIPFHAIGFLFQVGKIILRFPVCAFKAQFYAKKQETVVLSDPTEQEIKAHSARTIENVQRSNSIALEPVRVDGEIAFHEEDDDVNGYDGAIRFPDNDGEEDLQVTPVTTYVTSSNEDYMEPVKKDIVAAYIIFQRIGQNFRDMFCGSRPTSPTFKATVVNMVTVPFASTFLTNEGYLDYQAIEVDPTFGTKREKVSVDQMISKLLPNTVSVQVIPLDLDEEETIEEIKEESNSSKYLSLEDLKQAITAFRKQAMNIELLKLVVDEVQNNIDSGYISIADLNLGTLKAMKSEYSEGHITSELYEFLERKICERNL